MLKRKRRTRSTHRSGLRRELRQHAHQVSVKREPPPRERTVFVYSTTRRATWESE